MRTTEKLRALLEKDCVVAPSAHDGLSARLIVNAGFSAVYVAGSGIARGSYGLPDLGLISMAEVTARVAAIADVVDIPVIVDADNGYGNSLIAQRAARAFERAGVAAFHIEDQAFPKRSGPLAGKQIVPVREMVGKLKAVRDALHDDNFVVIARTDAYPVEGFNASVDRLMAYKEAGADALYLDFPETREEMAEVVRRIPGWHMGLSVHGHKMPFLSVGELKELGFKLIFLPLDLLRATIKAMQRTLDAIVRDGSSIAMKDDQVTCQEVPASVQTQEFLDRARQYE